MSMREEQKRKLEDGPVSRLRILQLNDVYTLQALPRFARAIRELGKDKGLKTISVLAGDFVAPSLLSSLDFGKGMIDVMNECGLDYCCFGNHENDIPYNELLKRISESKFTWINSNIPDLPLNTERVSATPWLLPNKTMPTYCIVKPKGELDRSVALLGLNTNDPGLYPVQCFGGAKILPVDETADKLSKELLEEKKVNLVVPMTHQSIAEDRLFMEKFGSRFPIIIGGHDHDVFHESRNGSTVLKVGENAVNVGIIDITFYEDDFHINTTLQPLSDFEEDESIRKRVDAHCEVLKQFSSAVLFRAPSVLSSAGIRHGPSTLATYLLTSLCSGLTADCALINSGNIRGKGTYKENHEFTYADLKKEMPFKGLVVAVPLSGKVITDAIKQSRMERKGKGGYLQLCSHITMKTEYEATHIRGREIDLNKIYKVACLYATIAKGMDSIVAIAEAGKKLGYDPISCVREEKHVIVSQFSRSAWISEMERLNFCFDYFDSDKDGLLTIDELRSTINNLPENQRFLGELVLTNIWNLMDLNDDGSVDPFEFLQFYFPVKYPNGLTESQAVSFAKRVVGNQYVDDVISSFKQSEFFSSGLISVSKFHDVLFRMVKSRDPKMLV